MIKINRYKESSPKTTLNNIRNILSKLQIDVTETWLSSVEGIYSVHLKVKNTNIFTNGKGTSKDYALASAYGELMERMQNLLYFRLNDNNENFFDLSEPYSYSPDEIPSQTIEEFPEQKKWIHSSKLNNSEVIKFWNNELKEKRKDIINIPFHNANGTLLIPIECLNFYYGSNGMAAGNTYSEAFVQGISEILERYAIKKLNNESISPPDITDYVKLHYAYFRDIINNIEEKGFKINIKDMNLGIGIPVVACVLYNLSDLTYFVNFGAHPSIELAIERSLSELFQGQDINNFTDMLNIFSSFKEIDKDANMSSIFVNGKGVYNPSLFAKEPSYFPNYDLLQKRYKNNEEMELALRQLITKLGYIILERDESFLGFPTYHFLIPGLSEIADINNVEILYKYHDYNKCKNFIRNLNILNEAEIKELITFLLHRNKKIKTIDKIFNGSLMTPNLYSNIPIALLLILLNLRLEDYKSAFKFSKEFIDICIEESNPKEIIRYYKKIATIICAKADNLDNKQIYDLLSKYCEDSEILESLQEIEKDNVLVNFPIMNCPHCDSCVLKETCHFNEEAKLFVRLQKIKIEDFKNKKLSV